MQNVAIIGAMINHFTMLFDGIPMTMGDNKNIMNEMRITFFNSTPHQCK